MRKIPYAASVCLVVVLALGIISVGCPKPTSAPKPVPTPTPTTAVKPAPAVTTAPPATKPSPKATSPSPVAKPSFKWPDPVIASTLDVGAAGYVVLAAVAGAMKKQGVTVRQVPVGTEQGRISLLTGGRAHFSILPMSTNYMAQEGAYEYANSDWGPQPLYNAVVGVDRTQTVGFVTAKDANIKTWADAKGKRMAHIVGSAASEVTGAAQLAFGGLTWKDVEIVLVPGLGVGGRAVIEGRADIGFGGSGTAWSFELEPSPRGIYYPPMPLNDEAGWKRALSIAPYLIKTTATSGAGLSKANPVEQGTYGFIGITVYDGSDLELVYQVTKMVNELYPEYKAVGMAVTQLDPANQVLSLPTPYHQGAIRYYKEVGRWTAENQQNNDRAVARLKVLNQAWKMALAQAAEKGVKVADFPAFWMKARAQALEAAGMEVIFRELSLLPKK